MVGFHVVATVDIGKLTMTTRQATGRPLGDAQKGTRRVDYALEGVREAAIYDGERLEPGMAFEGPAIVEDSGTTVVVHPGKPRRGGTTSAISAFISATERDGGRTMNTMTPITNDPITLEIIQNSLQSAADEMFAAMKKTAMSSIIYEVLDMGTGITDAKGEIACSGAGIPAFVGVLDKA